MSIDYSKLPPGLRHAMSEYIDHNILHGGFLYAVLSNNLRDSVQLADSHNLPRIPEIVEWLFSYAPSECWGSRERVDNWCNPENMIKPVLTSPAP